MLAGFDCVDYIIEFDEDTPENVIEEFMPDVLTKGSDYNLLEGLDSSKRAVK